jgi:rubrerythrin
MEREDLIQALRIDIASELEAMFLYDAHARGTSDPLVKKTFEEIRDEEREHMGELIACLRHVAPGETDLMLEGQGEVMEKAEALGVDFQALGVK